MNSSVELRQLRYFVAVAEELHFGRAVGRLHLDWPEVAAAIDSWLDEPVAAAQQTP